MVQMWVELLAELLAIAPLRNGQIRREPPNARTYRTEQQRTK